MIPLDDATIVALGSTAMHFRCFARNGRWGTCGGCPRDSNGEAYPEFCECSDRGDHQLSAIQLAEIFTREHAREQRAIAASALRDADRKEPR